MPEAPAEDDPSIVFGQEQALFTYNMARSLTGHSSRPVIERAQDAVRTAMHHFERPDIDAELATSGLMKALERDLDVAA